MSILTHLKFINESLSCLLFYSARLLFSCYLFSMWGLIKRSLQGVMYSVTIRLGLNPSAKDRRWSSRKKLIFSRKIPRWILGGMPVHLHYCRPRSLVDREVRSTYTCVVDSLPVLGMVQINNVGWAILGASFAKDPRKTGERPGSLLQGSAHRRQQVARANDGDCLHLTLRTARK